MLALSRTSLIRFGDSGDIMAPGIGGGIVPAAPVIRGDIGGDIGGTKPGIIPGAICAPGIMAL